VPGSAFLLIPDQAADRRATEALLQGLPHDAPVMAERAYDIDAVQARIQAQGAVPNVPPKRTGAGGIASAPCSAAAATPSSACPAA
jgi:hypothetical protein